MGKSAPKAPTPPDPNVVAAAQTKSNQATALYQSQLNNGNSSSPWGTVTNSYNPAANQWSQTTTLSPAEQAIFNQGTQAQGAALGVANQQIGRVGDALSHGLTAPQMQTGVQAGPLQTGYASGGPIASSFDPGSGVQGSVSTGAPVQSSFNPGGLISLGYASGGPIQSGIAGAGSIAGGYQNGGAIQSGFDPGQGVQGSISPTGQVLGYGSGGPIQGQVGGNTQGAVDQAILGNFAGQMQLLRPEMQQAAEQNNAQLVAQGLNPNDAAWQNAMTLFNNGQATQLGQAASSAIAAGNAEQNTLYGQQLQSGQFANAAQAQQYAQNEGQAQFANAALSGLFGQEQGAGQFANQAAGQEYGQNQGQAAFANQAQQQATAQAQQAAQFENAAQAQQFGQNQAQEQAVNAAQAQANAQNAQAAAFQNAGQAQQFGQNQAEQQAYNAAQAQAFGQNLQAGQFANSAAAQQFAQNEGQASFANSAQAQANAQNAAAAGFANTAQGQQFAQGDTNAQLNNSALQSDFSNQAYAQELPINEFNSLMSSGQVTGPQAAQLSQTSVAPTDVLGAYSLNAQVAQNNYNAQMQQYQSGLGGLFNLGSSVLGMMPFAGL